MLKSCGDVILPCATPVLKMIVKRVREQTALDRFREQFAVLEQSSLKNDNFLKEKYLPRNPI